MVLLVIGDDGLEITRSPETEGSLITPAHKQLWESIGSVNSTCVWLELCNSVSVAVL